MKKTIANKRVSLEVSSYGAEITSLKLDGFEYLWKADPKYYGRVSQFYFNHRPFYGWAIICTIT